MNREKNVIINLIDYRTMSNIFYIIGFIIVLTNLNIVLQGGKRALLLANFIKKTEAEQKQIASKMLPTCFMDIIEMVWLIYACCCATNSFYFTIYMCVIILNSFIRAICKMQITRTYLTIEAIITVIVESWLMYNCYTSF